MLPVNTMIFLMKFHLKGPPCCRKSYEELCIRRIDRIEITIITFSENAAVQQLTREPFLPVDTAAGTATGPGTASAPADYIFEPGKEAIVQELIPKSLKIQFYKALLDSFVAENGARMTAMQEAIR